MESEPVKQFQEDKQSGADNKKLIAGAIGLIFPGLPILVIICGANHRKIAWLLSLILFAGVIGLISRAISSSFTGIFINDKGYYSISRAQAIIWSVVVASILAVTWITNLRLGYSGVTIPSELISLMGLGLASAAGSPIVKASKGSEMYESISDPSLADFFQAEEKDKEEKVDLGKVQMFFFSSILLAYYLVKVWIRFQGAEGAIIDSLPPIEADSVVLLGVSNAGYLGYKAAQPKPNNG